MATFSVILEDVTRETMGFNNIVHNFDNQRTETIEANDLDDAWVQARQKYYVQKVDGPNTHIVDIQVGTVTFQEFTASRQAAPVPVSKAVAPPPTTPIHMMGSDQFDYLHPEHKE